MRALSISASRRCWAISASAWRAQVGDLFLGLAPGAAGLFLGLLAQARGGFVGRAAHRRGGVLGLAAQPGGGLLGLATDAQRLLLGAAAEVGHLGDDVVALAAAGLDLLQDRLALAPEQADQRVGLALHLMAKLRGGLGDLAGDLQDAADGLLDRAVERLEHLEPPQRPVAVELGQPQVRLLLDVRAAQVFRDHGHDASPPGKCLR